MDLAAAAVRLGTALRRLRIERGMSQRGLVQAVGLTAHSNLVQYELGRRIPPADIISAFERTLNDASGELRRLRAEALAERARDRTAAAARPVRTPRTLAMAPAPVPDFVGRAGQLRWLEALADAATGPGATGPVIVAIVGTAGIGKTALAVQFAHRVRGCFPGGQLYVDLCGHAPRPPRSSRDVLVGLLQALGVPAEEIPADQDVAASLYRSVLTDRRVLVLLDNAFDSAQVRPLLPAGAGCLALVTSRNRLTGLTARDGAARLALDVLTAAEARELFSALLGAGRVAAEPRAVNELARACVYLPLAVRIAAANLTNHPDWRVTSYLSDLRGGGLTALDADGDDDTAIRAAFDLSYATLPAPARRMFRLLGLVPGPDVTGAAAAALAGTAPADAARLLDRLAAGNLLAEPQPGRYAFHDLLRQYAVERVEAEDDQPARAAAMHRLLAWYLASARAAAQLLYPEAVRLGPRAGEPLAGDEPAPAARLADHTEALAWLDAERPNLVTAVRHAAMHGPYPDAWLLADTLRFYFVLRVYVADWSILAAAGLAAARAGNDSAAEAMAQLSLANCHHLSGDRGSALAHYTRALQLARRVDWPQCQASVLNNLAMLHQRSGRLGPALRCYTEALGLEERIGRLVGQAGCLGNLGTLYRRLGRFAEAADHYTRALDLARMIGSRNREGNVLFNLGELSLDQGLLNQALARLLEALAIQREIGDRVNEAYTLLTVAAVHRDRGALGRAGRLAADALVLARETGEHQVTSTAFNTLGTIELALGRTAEAVDHHRQALAFNRRIGDSYVEVEALVGLAAAHQNGPELAAARRYAAAALALARRDGYQVLEGHALTSLAAVRNRLGQHRQAARLARRAVGVHRAAGHRLGEARAVVVLGHALFAGDPSPVCEGRRAPSC